MKIIAFGDIHMTAGEAEKIPGIANADLVLLTGDLTNFGGKPEVKAVLDRILRVNPHVLAQFGNLDHPEINDYLEQLGLNLHGQARLFNKEVCLIGMGGSNYTPFHTPSEFSEKELHAIGQKAFQQGQDFTELGQHLHNKRIPRIFVSHVPPHNTLVDRLRNGRHVGSRAVRSLIEQYQPELCITGHIHEARGQDAIGTTRIYNPGMLKQEGWLTIDVKHTQLEIRLQ
ncbi:MAG: metallophosphoesterase family protein [Desulforhopalus sp.]